MTSTNTQTALDERLTRAAVEIELIQSCVTNRLEKDSRKLMSLSAVLRGATTRLNTIIETQTTYDKQTFLHLAHKRLSTIRAQAAAKAKAKRLRREENEQARRLFLAGLERIDAIAA